jgi:hypothetical protein
VKPAYGATVLDAGHGARLCLGTILDSLPPQCGGPEVVGWDWKQHQGQYESAAGVRWGVFDLTGTFDGSSFTPSEVTAYDPASPPRPADGDQLTTPCPTPAGGWHVLDPAQTNEHTFQRAQDVAMSTMGYVILWVDQSVNQAMGQFDDTGDNDLVDRLNDPQLEILDIQTTGDVADMERRVREVWGGMLCVTRVQHSRDELDRIQRELNTLPGMLSSGSGDARDRVTVEVVYDDGSYQRWADATYGPGTVVVTSALVAATG